ncbi:hypothetical protein Pgin01_01577 [Porphyromonas gingivalis]
MDYVDLKNIVPNIWVKIANCRFAVIIKNNIFVPIVVVPARLEQAEWGVRGNRVRIPSSPAAVSFYRRVGFDMRTLVAFQMMPLFILHY